MRACGDERTARSLDLVGRHPRHGGAGAGLGGGAQFGDHGQALPPPSLAAWPALGLSGWFGPHAGGDDLVPPWPAVALACGRRNAGAALWLKKRGGVPVIQIQDPKSGNRYFDLLVVPAHDRTRGANVITTTGSLNGIDDVFWKTAGFTGRSPVCQARGWRSPSAAATPLSGDRKRYRRLRQHPRRFRRSEGDRGDGLAAQHAIEALRGAVRRTAIWDGTDAILFAYLAAATAIIVTSDSVNMVSEACATRRPVYIAALHPERGRLKHFHDQVMAASLARPFDGTLEYWEYKPLRETTESPI